jgi:hypothetical protein
MRIYESNTITISEDNSTDPQQILFKDVSEVADILSLTECRNVSETFPVATTAVSMGNITAGNFIWCKPTNACSLVIDGQIIPIAAGKVTKMWCNFAALSVTVTTAVNKIQLIIAGD